MPNYCNYSMKILGNKENVEKMVSYLQSDYSYKKIDERTVEPFKEPVPYLELQKCDAEKHFFRVFDANNGGEYIDRENGLVETTVRGYCAWSVCSCMFDKERGTYYRDWTKRAYDNFRGTHMVEATRDLDLIVQIFSEESGCGFMEHYIVNKGIITTEDCVDYKELHDEDGEQKTEGGIEWDFSI